METSHPNYIVEYRTNSTSGDWRPLPKAMTDTLPAAERIVTDLNAELDWTKYRVTKVA